MMVQVRLLATLLALLCSAQSHITSAQTLLDKESLEQTEEQKKCYALALAGGGVKGAFTSAAMWQLARSLNPEEVQWDVVTGVSVGAVNAGGIGLFEKGQEKEGTQFMLDKWATLNASQVWEYWPDGWYDALFKETGLIDNAPLYQFIADILGNKTFKRKVIASSVDMVSAVYVQLDMDYLHHDEIAKAILASASVPGVFPVASLRNWHLIDGGTTWNTNIIGAITKCRELGAREKDIVLDVITLIPAELPIMNHTNNKTYATWQYYERLRQIRAHQSDINDIAEFMQANPKINYRYLVQPSVDLCHDWDLLSPNPEQNAKMIEQGKKDTKASIEMGPGAAFKKMVDNLPSNYWGKRARIIKDEQKEQQQIV